MRVFVLALSTTLACGRVDTFACRQNADCGPDDGQCEADGWCSFPDATCASGRRYGRWVGDELGDRCVPPSVADTGVATTSSASSSSSSSTTIASTATSNADTSTSTSDPTTSSEVSSTGDVDPDLIAWYRFDEDTFAGTVLDSANGHDGTCTRASCPTPTMGVIGNAASFDGIDDIVLVPDDPDFATDTGYTLAAWVAVDATQDGFRSVVAKPLAADTDEDSWELARNEVALALANMTALDGTHPEAISRTQLQDSKWTHLASTWDGSELRLYVNGETQVAVPAPSIMLTQQGVNFGAGWDFGAAHGFLHGSIDELQIWRRALAPDEIATLAHLP